MKISELSVGQGNVDVEGTLKEIGETRTFNKFGRELSVANAILQDDSGSIKLTLWNDDVKRFKDGDKIKIVNGYVNEFQGEKQLTSGKFGKMELADGSGQAQLTEDSTEEGGDMPVEESSEPAEESSEEPIKEVEF